MRGYHWKTGLLGRNFFVPIEKYKCLFKDLASSRFTPMKREAIAGSHRKNQFIY
jgi:hypothetical protein